MSNQRIDVEQIIHELRAEVNSRDLPEIAEFDEMASMEVDYAQKGEPFDPDFLLNEMELANRSFTIDSNIQIEGRLRLLKRLMRKLSFFIVRQLAESMTQYNIHIVRSMNQIRNYIIMRNSADKDVVLLKDLVSGDISWKIETQSSRIREISRENAELKKQLRKFAEAEEKNSLTLEKANAEIEVLKVKLRAVAGQCGMMSDNRGGLG